MSAVVLLFEISEEADLMHLRLTVVRAIEVDVKVASDVEYRFALHGGVCDRICDVRPVPVIYLDYIRAFLGVARPALRQINECAVGVHTLTDKAEALYRCFALGVEVGVGEEELPSGGDNICIILLIVRYCVGAVRKHASFDYLKRFG